MTELWPPKQIPLYGPKWSKQGSRCTAPKCGTIRQATSMLPRAVGENNGPQGSWKCEAGHCGWIWPKECEYPTR